MEYLDIVNDSDEVIGRATDTEAYEQKLTHRIVHVLLFNSDGQMLLQKRSQLKKFCPGAWSTAVGGHVQSGESYEQGALREAQEEIGATLVLTKLAKLEYQTDSGIKKFLTIFKAQYDGQITPNPEEVAAVEFFPLAQIYKMIEAGEKFHPELLFILKNCHLSGE